MGYEPERREQVIQHAAAFGYTVSSTRLARWHRAGLLPRPRQRALGRGLGTETLYPPGTSAQLVALCQIREDERRLDRVAFRLWWDGFPVDPRVVRSHLAAVAVPMEEKVRQSVANADTATGIDGPLRRALGRRRIEIIAVGLEQVPPAREAAPAAFPSESAPTSIPSLDDFAELAGQAMAQRLSGPPMASLIDQASDDDLLQARERARSLLSLMQVAAAPLAWLYGKHDSIFGLMDRLINGFTPSDFAGLTAAALAFGPQTRPDLLAAIDAGIEPPPLAHELRKILVIRERVPGAAEVFTPMAIRALLRDKEAAHRYRPQIEQFITDNRAEIEAALTAAANVTASASAPPPTTPAACYG